MHTSTQSPQSSITVTLGDNWNICRSCLSVAFALTCILGCVFDDGRDNSRSESANEVGTADQQKLSDPYILACTKLIPEGLNPSDPSVTLDSIREVLGEETSKIEYRNLDLFYKRAYDFGGSVAVTYNEQNQRFISMNIFEPTAIQSYDQMIETLGEPKYSSSAQDTNHYSYDTEVIVNGRIVKNRTFIKTNKDGSQVLQMSFMSR